MGEAVNNTNHWYPVYTHSRAEKKAFEALTKKGIAAYLPLRKTLKYWSDRKKWIDEPLIKSYLFVNINANEKTEVLMTSGIARFIYFGGKVATIPERQILSLKLLLTNSIDIEVTEENLQPGELVIIKAGPLKGLQAEVVAYRSEKQLALRFDNIGYSIIMHVGASLLERVDQ